MKTKRINSKTTLLIRRTVKNPHESGNWFEMTYADALKQGYLSSHSGTVDVQVELPQSEYVNYENCDPTLVYGPMNALVVDYLTDPVPGRAIARHGELVYFDEGFSYD